MTIVIRHALLAAVTCALLYGCSGGPDASTPAASGPSTKESETVKPKPPADLDVSKLDLLKGIERRVLDNGMTVFVKEDHRLPIATVVTSYRVGSVHETEGATGLAHFLEHMMFKGTQKLKKGEIDAITFESGGSNNAYTTNDYTAYWFTVHAETLDRFLEIESDRMRNCLLDRKEWEQELKTVIEELNRSLDSPWGALWHEIEPAVFKTSSYHHPVIGFRKDLENMKYEDMVSFYKDHYGPNNATMVVFGDVHKDTIFARVQELFGGYEKVKEAAPPKMPEPAATQEARVSLETDKSLHRLGLAYRSDRVGSDTDIRLDVLSQILSTGKDSRLFKKLVDGAGSCTDVSTINDSRRHDGVYFVFAELREKRDPAEVEKAVIEELEKLKTEPIPDRELQKAKNIIAANFVFAKERQYSLADDIAKFEAFGAPEYLRQYLARVTAVTAEDLRQTAEKMFTPENRTVATARAKGGRTPEPPMVSSGDADFGDYSEDRLRNGLTLLVKSKRDLPVVSFHVYVDSGQTSEDASKAGVAALVGQLLDQGTAPPGGTARTAEEIAAYIDFTGSQLSTSATGLTIKTLTPHAKDMLELIRDMLLYPTFPASKVADKKDLQLSELQGRQDSPNLVARDLFMQAVYKGHPMARIELGTPETLQALNRNDVQAHHRKCFRPENTIIAIAGDVDPEPTYREVRRRFSEWNTRGESVLPAIPTITRQKQAQRIVESREGNQVNYVIGHLAIDRKHPDYAPLRVLEHIFCRSTGFADRLSSRVRDEAGMAYEVWGIMTERADRYPGPFMIYIGSAPQHKAKPVEMTLDILDDLLQNGPTDEEIARAKNYLLRTLPFAWESTDQLAAYMVTTRRLTLGIDYARKYARDIRAVTKEDLVRVARAHLAPEALTTVIVGPVDSEGNVK